jgi:hypothetical protein
MSEIQAGDGWRLLGPDEVIRKGDEHYTGNNWIETEDMGFVVAEDTYRRRIPAKPEAMEIDDELTIKTGDITDQPCLLHCEEDKPYWICFDPHECRKLADWLTRYADWREAQDSVAKTPPN